MSEIMGLLRATMEVPVAVGLIGWGAVALLVGHMIHEAVYEVQGWRARWKRKQCQPIRRGTCVTGAQACHECMLGDGYCRKEVQVVQREAQTQDIINQSAAKEGPGR